MNQITYKKQSGAVLFISLIMLLLLTLIGVSGMQTTILEEKMSGNYRDQNIAFQAAESTLLEAEKYIMSPAPTYPGVGGLLDIADAEPADYYAPSLWQVGSFNSASTLQAFSDSLGFPPSPPAAALAYAPRYVIKKISQVGSVSTFRITASAIGRSPGTRVILQTIFERTN